MKAIEIFLNSHIFNSQFSEICLQSCFRLDSFNILKNKLGESLRDEIVRRAYYQNTIE